MSTRHSFPAVRYSCPTIGLVELGKPISSLKWEHRAGQFDFVLECNPTLTFKLITPSGTLISRHLSLKNAAGKVGKISYSQNIVALRYDWPLSQWKSQQSVVKTQEHIQLKFDQDIVPQVVQALRPYFEITPQRNTKQKLSSQSQSQTQSQAVQPVRNRTQDEPSQSQPLPLSSSQTRSNSRTQSQKPNGIQKGTKGEKKRKVTIAEDSQPVLPKSKMRKTDDESQPIETDDPSQTQRSESYEYSFIPPPPPRQSSQSTSTMLDPPRESPSLGISSPARLQISGSDLTIDNELKVKLLTGFAPSIKTDLPFARSSQTLLDETSTTQMKSEPFLGDKTFSGRIRQPNPIRPLKVPPVLEPPLLTTNPLRPSPFFNESQSESSQLRNQDRQGDITRVMSVEDSQDLQIEAQSIPRQTVAHPNPPPDLIRFTPPHEKLISPTQEYSLPPIRSRPQDITHGQSTESAGSSAMDEMTILNENYPAMRTPHAEVAQKMEAEADEREDGFEQSCEQQDSTVIPNADGMIDEQDGLNLQRRLHEMVEREGVERMNQAVERVLPRSCWAPQPRHPSASGYCGLCHSLPVPYPVPHLYPQSLYDGTYAFPYADPGYQAFDDIYSHPDYQDQQPHEDDYRREREREESGSSRSRNDRQDISSYQSESQDRSQQEQDYLYQGYSTGSSTSRPNQQSQLDYTSKHTQTQVSSSSHKQVKGKREDSGWYFEKQEMYQGSYFRRERKESSRRTTREEFEWDDIEADQEEY